MNSTIQSLTPDVMLVTLKTTLFLNAYMLNLTALTGTLSLLSDQRARVVLRAWRAVQTTRQLVRSNAMAVQEEGGEADLEQLAHWVRWAKGVVEQACELNANVDGRDSGGVRVPMAMRAANGTFAIHPTLLAEQEEQDAVMVWLEGVEAAKVDTTQAEQVGREIDIFQVIEEDSESIFSFSTQPGLLASVTKVQGGGLLPEQREALEALWNEVRAASAKPAMPADEMCLRTRQAKATGMQMVLLGRKLIDACIGIANTIIDIGRAVHDAQGLPPKLRELLEKLPAIQELLESAQESCEEGRITDDASKSAQPILKQCAEALAELRDIFRKACPKDGENRTKRIWRGAKTVFFGRDNQVQKLLVTIQDDLRLLEQKEVYVIGDKLDALQQVTQGLADNEDGKYTHTGAGNIIANEGGSPTNYVVGGSNNRQINNPGVYNEGPSTRPEAPPAPFCAIPFRRDPDFVDRGTLLDQVREKCAAPASCIALVGLGGVGKSQLAIEHCYQTADASPETWVFWVHAGTRARFEQGYRRIAEATKMDGWDDPKADVLRLVRSWLCDKSNGRWVMVVDNADDASVFFQNPLQSHATGSFDQSTELLSDFLPQSPNGSILVTSRSRDDAYRLTGTYSSVIEVKPMDKDDALALLKKKLGIIANEDEAVELIDALDFMPLALTQAAAFIRQGATRMSVPRYVEKVRKSDRDRARLLMKDVGDSRRDGKASNSIIATWQISFEHIRTRTPTAARLLSLMSLFDPQGIPESLLHNRYSEEGDGEDGEADFDDDICMLTSFSLVRMSVDGREFEMHRLVQFSTKKWLELCSELEVWQSTYAALMDDNYPVGRPENWAVCQALFPHAQAVVNNRPKDVKALEAWASVLFKAAWYASEIGQYSKAYEMGSAALHFRETILGEEHPDTLNSLNSLGIVLNWQGQYSEAEAMHQQGLEAKERVLGKEHPSTFTSMANLASTSSTSLRIIISGSSGNMAVRGNGT
ncbi:uncharacterized protein CC84DRAFT_1203804 [Paraphaeosphaeria sporulosa]|uniref:Uncharacterized protein n=1 Tax=Paraphaeosphaeria sporulosa TaxID=1460663 RepID=A0A177CMA0_9PLEO|nr:uncharacterized protein CC84DRAFT_1203804 [Paraphaeosphaeria sporulosa]OAG08426.1 hypothetical protein CC84DRAFT_1203804 [Paraphaeosphaeria sporulosa]